MNNPNGDPVPSMPMPGAPQYHYPAGATPAPSAPLPYPLTMSAHEVEVKVAAQVEAEHAAKRRGLVPAGVVSERRAAWITPLNFDALRDANADRVGQFKTPNGDLAHTTSDGSDWSILEWAGAMCGEAGEAANVAKKMRRGDFKNDPAKGKKKLARELADNVIYSDLTAKAAGIDLGQAVQDAWNEKSVEIGFAGRLYNGHYQAAPPITQPPVVYAMWLAYGDQGAVFFALGQEHNKPRVQYPKLQDALRWVSNQHARWEWTGPAELKPKFA